MSESRHDIWSQWLLHRRHGDDPQYLPTLLAYLSRIRDTVLDHAHLTAGDTVLDVGCGDGLIAFGALEREPACTVIFSDMSQDLVHHVQTLAQRLALQHRCQFVQAAAEDLSALPDASVDVVTTRSVLIYVEAKAQAFAEFYRVLKPQGRLSIFEPINRFVTAHASTRWWGYDVTPVQELAEKISAVYARLQPRDTDPMLHFDERDLLQWAEQAGFTDIDLTLEVEIKPYARPRNWETLYGTAGNPKIPTLAEAIQQALTGEEAEQFIAHVRPLADARQGKQRFAQAYLWAVKH
jgi:ubiquinone/menaquinone biosynthesis C-methylase UbiE